MIRAFKERRKAGVKIPHALIVEDNPLLRRAAELNLRRFGLVVHTARNGEQAAELVRNNCYDLILMDVDMPKMSGEEATNLRKIQLERGRRCPIVAVTASEEKAHGLDAIVDDCVNKPADYDHIVGKWLPDT